MHPVACKCTKPPNPVQSSNNSFDLPCRQKLQQATDIFRHRVDGDMVRNFPEDLVRRLAVDK